MKKTFAVILCASMTGCATIFGSSKDNITIRSNDPEANISVNGNIIGKGQVVYSVARGKSVILTASKKGCSDRSMPTDTTFHAVTLLDIFFWPTFFVDIATGAMYRADPTEYTISPACE